MLRMSFGPSVRSCPDRARKLEIAERHKRPTRRPIELVLDQQIPVFDLDEEIVAVTARPRPYLWEMSL